MCHGRSRGGIHPKPAHLDFSTPRRQKLIGPIVRDVLKKIAVGEPQVIARIVIYHNEIVVDRSWLSVVGVLKMATGHYDLCPRDSAVSHSQLRLVEGAIRENDFLPPP